MGREKVGNSPTSSQIKITVLFQEHVHFIVETSNKKYFLFTQKRHTCEKLTNLTSTSRQYLTEDN